jgi:hypothetical protein
MIGVSPSRNEVGYRKMYVHQMYIMNVSIRSWTACMWQVTITHRSDPYLCPASWDDHDKPVPLDGTSAETPRLLQDMDEVMDDTVYVGMIHVYCAIKGNILRDIDVEIS